MININNYYNSTKAVFKGCKIPKRNPDYISYNEDGDISSRYWYGNNKNGNYIIRESDHWVNMKPLNNNKIFRQCKSIASCIWHLTTNKIKFKQINYHYYHNSKPKTILVKEKPNLTGKAYLKDFIKI